MAREIQIIGLTIDEAKTILKEIIRDCIDEVIEESKSVVDKALSPGQVTKMLGISRPTLCRYVNEGLIRRHDLGQKKKIFYLSEIQEDIKTIASKTAAQKPNHGK